MVIGLKIAIMQTYRKQNKNYTMGRPPSRPLKLKDGFYIEIRNKGSKSSGIKLHSDTKQQMMRTVKMYERAKDVIIYGESKNGKWVKKDPILHEAS